jgi:S-DNA-T family DNA segregation ATPase FtsK/SpoIIIE
MSDDARRRLGAITALVLGFFVGLTLLPVPITGPVGRSVGEGLWRLLGAGALGIPLLGIGLALAGFDRLGKLDMKRAAVLVAGLSALVPYLIGVVSHVTLRHFDDGLLLGKIVGVVPGFFAIGIPQRIGPAGAVLVGFLALSALTLVTFAWHPLQRLERRTDEPAVEPDAAVTPTAEPDAEEPALRRRKSAPAPVAATDEEPEEEAAAPPSLTARISRLRRERKPKSADAAAAAAAAVDEESDLPPIELLSPPTATDNDVSGPQLDRLGQSLLDTLRTFKVEGQIAGRTTGPVVTQFEVVPAPGVKAGRIVALADDLAMAMRAPSIRVAPIPGKGAVGVEVPNPTARLVTLREIFESPDWSRRHAVLPIALGRDL